MAERGAHSVAAGGCMGGGQELAGAAEGELCKPGAAAALACDARTAGAAPTPWPLRGADQP